MNGALITIGLLLIVLVVVLVSSHRTAKLKDAVDDAHLKIDRLHSKLGGIGRDVLQDGKVLGGKRVGSNKVSGK